MGNMVLLSAGSAQSNIGCASDSMICAGIQIFMFAILVVFIIFFVIGLKK